MVWFLDIILINVKLFC